MSIIGSGGTQTQQFTEELQQTSFQLGVGLFGISLGTGFLNEIATYITQTSGSNADSLYAVVMASSVGQSASYYPNYLTNAQFADRLAKNLLGTKGTLVADDAWQAGADWAKAALDGGMTRAAVAKMAVEAVAAIPTDDASYGAAAATFNNKVAVSEYYTLTAGGSSTSVSALASTIANVTSTTDVSSASAIDAVLAVTSGGASGTVSSLTTGLDSIIGAAGNDQVYGVVSTSSTLNPFDVIDGGAGTDTLHITLNGASYAADSTIKNIEVINVRASTAHDFSANALTGLTNLNYEGSVAASTFTNIGSASTQIGVKNIATGAADLTVKFSDAALTGTSDTVTVNLDAAGDANNTPDLLIQTTGSSNGAENLKVVTSGTASNLAKLESTDNNGTGGANSVLKTLTVTGDKDLTVTTAIEFASNTGTVDASAFTGKLSIGLDTGGIVKVTGGSGNDTFKMTTGLTVDDTIDGGAGVDTVSVTDMDTFTLANYTKMTNIEIIDQTATNNANLSLVTGGAALTKVVLRENATTNKSITASDLAAGVAVDLVQTTDGQLIGTTTLGLKDASGTADALTVTLKGVAAHGAADNAVADLAFTNIETLNLVSASTSTTGGVLAAADANTVSDISSDTVLTTINASGSSALTVTVGSEASKLTKFDGSAMTADMSVTLATGDVSVTGGSGDDTFIFGTSLNNKDVVVGGANSASTKEDLLTATVTGLTATTGVLNISGVERINLTNAGTATIDATKIVGASEVAFNGASTATTITGLAAGGTVGLGFKSTDSTVQGTVTASLADATGTADAVTFNLNDTGDGDTNSVTIKTSGIETVNFAYSTTATSLSSHTVTATDLAAATVKVSGSDGDTDNVFTISSVNAATTTIDASTFKGKLVATANTNTATAILANGLVANNITGGDKADVVTIGAATNTLVQTVAGGAGSDTLNITLKAGNQDFTSISAFETINITVDNSAAVAMTNVAGIEDTNLTKLTITGGNSLSTFTNTADTIAATTALATIDTSGFKGAASLFFADDTLTSANSITGGEGNDTVDAIYTNSSQTLKMSAIDNLNISNSTGASTIDLANVTGLTKLVMKDVTAAVTINNYNLATTLQLGLGVDGTATTDVDNVAVTVTGSSVTGTTDTLNVKVQNVNPTASIVANGIETINLSIATDTGASQALSISDTNATNKYVVNVTDGTTAQGFTISSLSADATTVNGATFIGDLTFDSSARLGTSAMTVTGGVGNDTLVMKHANDVIEGGSQGSGGRDTLKIVANLILGGSQIDLSSTVDQITTFNGSANSAIQKGFESVDLSGVTGSNGADITAFSGGSSIIGTSNGDVITGGAGADSITGGKGGDAITISASSTTRDTLTLTGGDTQLTIGGTGDNGTVSGFDIVTGFVTGTTAANKDLLDFAGTGALAAAADTNGTDSTLTIAGAAVKSHRVSATGLATFDDADTYAAALTINSEGTLAAVLQYLTGQDIGNAGDSLVFVVTGSSGYEGSYVYSQVATTAGTTGGYQVVKLVGVTATGLETTASTTDNLVFIA